jgi:hypothetical protein
LADTGGIRRCLESSEVLYYARRQMATLYPGKSMLRDALLIGMGSSIAVGCWPVIPGALTGVSTRRKSKCIQTIGLKQ